MNLTLAIPALRFNANAEHSLTAAEVPYLQMLAGRGRRSLNSGSLYDYLAEHCGLEYEAELPLAVAAAMCEELPISEGFWLRADPIRLQASTHGVYCLGSADLNLSRTEAETLINSLNIFLAGDGIRFHLGASNTAWYMQTSAPKDLQLAALDSVIGKDLRNYLPQGQDAALLEALLSEIQMLLFPHALNQARRDAGLPTVDGLWVYGNSARIQSWSWPWQHCYSNDLSIRGLAKLSGHHYSAVPASLAQVSHESGEVLVVYPALQDALQSGDWQAYLAAVSDLETAWLMPLWKALRSQRIKQVTLYLPGGQYKLKSLDLYRFWRRPASLDEVLC